ncbi:MAG: hypothetical protein Q9Q40_14905 [Acidobacteriota bacterium]|nr:hypothetical protein [Acidobacteriota bacterium]
MRNRLANGGGYPFLLLAWLLYAWHAWSFGWCLQDDAFISLRYARNLAEGIGLVYNPGEYVEGFTNFLWTIGMAALFVLDLPPVKALWLAGLTSGGLALWAAFDLARTLAPEPLRGAAGGSAAVIAACLPFFVAESVMGLETAFFAALSVAGIARYLRETTSPPGRRLPISGVILAMATLTRPEGALIAGLAGLSNLFGLARERCRPDTSFWVRWLLFALPVIGLEAFRWLYYGDLVPNTFHAKVGGGMTALLRGLTYTGEFVWHAFPLLIAAGAGAWVLLQKRDRRPLATLPFALPWIFIAYVAWVGGDYKPTFRFFATPALFFAAWAGVGLVSWFSSDRNRPIANFLLVAGSVCLAGAILVGLGGGAREFARWRAQVLPVHRAAGAWLGTHFEQNTWMATGNAGVLPYESSLPTIDMYGLCDRHIAQRRMPHMGEGPPGHEKGDGAYVLERNPRLILFMRARFSQQPITEQAIASMRKSVSERELWEHPEFHERYALRSQRLPGFYFNYFERKEGP